jgi:predicted metal-binding protein
MYGFVLTTMKRVESMENRKILAFKKDAGISHALIQRLLTKGRSYGLNAVFPFGIDEIVVAEWVHLKCRYGCSRFNTNWCCPPATPDPDRVRAILAEYRWALLLVGSKTCADFYRDNHRKRAMQVRCWKGTVSLERMLFLQGYYKAFSLVGECCALCRECAYPDDCRFPQEKRPSVESFSIDVIGTLKNLGTTSTVASHTAETFNYYGIILLE